MNPAALPARIASAPGLARWGRHLCAEVLHQQGPGVLASEETRVERQGDGLRMRRRRDNLDTLLQPLPVVETADGAALAGEYRCGETGGTLRLEARDGAVFALFTGRLGQGRMEPVLPAGPDVWLLRTRRSMDAPAPGDWTLMLRRDAQGAVAGLTLGCWLARGLDFTRTV